MSTPQTVSRQEILKFIQHIHAGQTRAGNVPAWHHLDRVSRLLEHVLEETQEGTAADREMISWAGLGHDALEDTKVSSEELQRYFGPMGVEIIQGMTNHQGDEHQDSYLQQVATASEEIRLVKFSDLFENYTSVIYGLPLLGLPWVHEFFLPIVEPMLQALERSRFTRYAASAERLKLLVMTSRTILLEEIARQESHSNA